MLRRTGLIAALLAAGLLAPALTGTAFHNPGIPTLDALTLNGQSWVAWKVTVAQAAKVSWEVEADLGNVELASIGLYALKGDGSPNGAFVFSTWGSNSQETHVELPVVGVLADQRAGSATGHMGAASTYDKLDPGSYYFVAVASAAGGPLTTVKFALYGAAGVAVAGRSTGSGAFAYQNQDFHGGANVFVNVPPGLRATAMVDDSITQRANGRMFALFQSLGGAIYNSRLTLMDYTDPSGTNNAGSFIYFVQGGRNGDYKFHVQANADARVIVPPEVFLVGADVTLP